MKSQKVKAPAKNGGEKILYPMRHYAFGRPYNHAIRNVSDLESRYFGFQYAVSHIVKTCINTTIKAVKAI